MADATLELTQDDSGEEPQAQWELAECTCPDWCERDHELD